MQNATQIIAQINKALIKANTAYKLRTDANKLASTLDNFGFQKDIARG